MKTATTQELCDESAEAWQWVEAGEEVAVSRHGKVIARLVPIEQAPATEPHETKGMEKVDWTTSAAFTMDRSKMRVITEEELAALWEELRGPRF